MRKQDWYIVGGLMLLIVATRRSRAWGSGWHFPVPDLLTRDPTGKPLEFAAVISSGFRGSRPDHNGVDICYPQAGSKPSTVPNLEASTGVRNVDASGKFWAPRGTPVLAAKSGKVWSVGKSAHGIGIVLDHGKPWATFYQHLETTPFAPHAMGREIASGRVSTVEAGQQIGTMGASTLDSARFRHLHFEAWFEGVGAAAAQDPAPVARSFARSQWKLGP